MGPESLRFDFSHFSKLEQSDILKVENFVNTRIENSIILEENRAIAMGNYFFTDLDGNEAKVEFPSKSRFLACASCAHIRPIRIVQRRAKHFGIIKLAQNFHL